MLDSVDRGDLCVVVSPLHESFDQVVPVGDEDTIHRVFVFPYVTVAFSSQQDTPSHITCRRGRSSTCSSDESRGWTGWSMDNPEIST